MVTRLEPPGWLMPWQQDRLCAGHTWRSTSFLLLLACNAVIFPGTAFVVSQIAGASPASQGVVATIRQEGPHSTQLLPATSHLVSSSQCQAVSMPWCQLGCCVALLLGARCTTKRGCRTQRAASCKLVVTGPSQKDTQRHSGSGELLSSTVTCNVVWPATDGPQFVSVASSSQPQVMQSSMSSHQRVAVPSLLTQSVRARGGRESSSRKAGARAGRTSAGAERTARRAVGQRLLRASQQPVAVQQLSYDASRVRTKLQLALLAPELLHSGQLREVKTPATSHTLNGQFLVSIPANSKSVEVSFPNY